MVATTIYNIEIEERRRKPIDGEEEREVCCNYILFRHQLAGCESSRSQTRKMITHMGQMSITRTHRAEIEENMNM